jgi:hypothetical protein
MGPNNTDDAHEDSGSSLEEFERTIDEEIAGGIDEAEDDNTSDED